MKLTKTQIYFITLAITLVLGYVLWNMMFNKKEDTKGKKMKMGKPEIVPPAKSTIQTQEVKTVSGSNNMAQAQRTTGGRTWTNPKGLLCPPGVRAIKNTDGTWTCISGQRVKCPNGYDVLYVNNTPKGCINLTTGQEKPLIKEA